MSQAIASNIRWSGVSQSPRDAADAEPKSRFDFDV